MDCSSSRINAVCNLVCEHYVFVLGNIQLSINAIQRTVTHTPHYGNMF